MQQLITLLESGDTEAVKQLIKYQLNETSKQTGKNLLQIKNTKSMVQFEATTQGALVVSTGTLDEGPKTSVLVSKVDLPKVMEFLNGNSLLTKLDEATKQFGKIQFVVKNSEKDQLTIGKPSDGRLHISINNEPEVSRFIVSKIDLPKLMEFLNGNALSEKLDEATGDSIEMIACITRIADHLKIAEDTVIGKQFKTWVKETDDSDDNKQWQERTKRLLTKIKAVQDELNSFHRAMS